MEINLDWPSAVRRMLILPISPGTCTDKQSHFLNDSKSKIYSKKIYVNYIAVIYCVVYDIGSINISVEINVEVETLIHQF